MPLPEPEVINHAPGCVALKLHFDEDTPTSPSPDPFAPPPKTSIATTQVCSKVLLKLTIQFSGEQEFDVPAAKALGIPGGKATYGIKRCELNFALSGCTLPLDEVALKDPFLVSASVEVQQKRSTEAQAGLGGEKMAGTLGIKQAGEAAEKLTVETFQVHKTGDDANPRWIFEAKIGHSILKGSLSRADLGTLHLTDFPVVQATVHARVEDICITWGEVGFAKNITRNKLALIERAIAKHHIGSQLSKPLSEVKWFYA
jgi:hypothetical protein